MKKHVLLSILVFMGFLLNAQNANTSNEKGHFLVELEPRSPDVEAMVNAYEGTKAIAMLANNIDGNEVNINSYKGKTVLIWFWNLGCDICLNSVSTLNTLQAEFPDLKIISFADETSEELLNYRKSNPIQFDVVGNSKMLAEGPYGGELGYPKMFIVDQEGMIKWVFPSKDFLSPKFDLYQIVKTLYMQLNQ